VGLTDDERALKKSLKRLSPQEILAMQWDFQFRLPHGIRLISFRRKCTVVVYLNSDDHAYSFGVFPIRLVYSELESTYFYHLNDTIFQSRELEEVRMSDLYNEWLMRDCILGDHEVMVDGEVQPTK
jgi:hypothetical protein